MNASVAVRAEWVYGYRPDNKKIRVIERNEVAEITPGSASKLSEIIVEHWSELDIVRNPVLYFANSPFGVCLGLSAKRAPDGVDNAICIDGDVEIGKLAHLLNDVEGVGGLIDMWTAREVECMIIKDAIERHKISYEVMILPRSMTPRDANRLSAYGSPHDFIGIDEAAQRLGVSRTRIQHLHRRRKGPRFVKVGHRTWIFRKDVEFLANLRKESCIWPSWDEMESFS